MADERIEPDPCVPITDGSAGYPTHVRHHALFSSHVAHTRVGVQAVMWLKGNALGRYLWPLPELRPDGTRILKGFG